jgi:hypothetical protein
MSTDSVDIKRIQLANKMNFYLMAKDYPSLAGDKAPLAAVTIKGCNSHGILYSCSKCGWNHCVSCGSSEVSNSIKGVSGWMGLCKKCMPQIPEESSDDGPLKQLSTLRLDPSSAEYKYVVSLIHTSIAMGNAFYAQAPFATHGIPVKMHCRFKIVEIVRHTSEGMIKRFALTSAAMQELRVERYYDHGLSPMEEYPIFVGCCRTESYNIAQRGFCPFYTESHAFKEGVVFGSKYFQFAMTQANQGSASLRTFNESTRARRYVCIARALTGRLEQINVATDRKVSAGADTGCDSEEPCSWVRAYFDTDRLKLEYIVVYELVDGPECDVEVVWGKAV